MSLEMWLGLISLVVAVVGIPLAWFFGRRAKQKPDFRYAIDQEELISPEDALKKGGLEVRFRDVVLERLCRSYVAIWNQGGDTIRGTDIASSDRLRVELPASDTVLSARVVSVSRDEIVPSVEPNDEAPQFVKLGFSYLNPGDGYVVEILHEKNASPKFSGTPMGATLRQVKSVNLGNNGRSRSQMTFWRRFRDTYSGPRMFPVVSLLILFVVFLVGSVLVLMFPPSPNASRTPDWIDGLAPWLIPAFVVSGLFMLYDAIFSRLRLKVPRTVFAIDYQAAFEWTPDIYYKDGSGEVVRVGDMIEHRDFGVGVINSKTGSGKETVISVSFETSGTKRLNVSIAPIEYLATTRG
jgi:hypothetical protein